MERRLAAIFAADVVSYSRLMGEDEAGTLERLKSLRKQLVQPQIAAHKGRIVKLMGDGLLAEFPSVVEAVGCAVDIQRSMAERETDLQDKDRISLRIGVNLGDVIVEGSDIYGDGVNVAARLEGLADPGGVCISGTAFDTVDGKLSLVFEELGPQTIKNIAKPVRAYSVLFGQEEPSMQAPDNVPLELPDKPSIAVMPFTNLSGDTDQEFFADGISEDIITELSKERSLLVIARNSSFAFKGKQIRSQDVGRELGVAYIVEGSVRKAGNRIRVSAQLVEAASGNQLWSQRYDRELKDIFDVQDELTEAITGILPAKLDRVVHEKANRKHASNLSAYEYLLRGRWIWNQDASDMTSVVGMFEKAVAADPGLARAHGAMALAFAQSLFFDADAIPIARVRAWESARAALAADSADATVQADVAATYLLLGEFDLARSHAALAMEINPNDINAIATQGTVFTYTGQLDSGLELLHKMWRLDPHQRDYYYEAMFEAYYFQRQFAKAVEAYRSWRNPSNYVLDVYAAALAQMGDLDAAYVARDQFFEHYPDHAGYPKLVESHLRMIEPQELKDLMLEGYRLAGFDV